MVAHEGNLDGNSSRFIDQIYPRRVFALDVGVYKLPPHEHVQEITVKTFRKHSAGQEITMSVKLYHFFM